MTSIDHGKLLEASAIRGEDEKETRQIHALCDEAKRFLSSFPWVGRIEHIYFGYGVADIVAIFLFEFAPTRASVDPRLWVVVGDIPPAYLVTDDAPDAAAALSLYIQEMRKWVTAVRSGGGLADIIPVDAAPTLANAQDLERRLNFLQSSILPRCRLDLDRRL